LFFLFVETRKIPPSIRSADIEILIVNLSEINSTPPSAAITGTNNLLCQTEITDEHNTSKNSFAIVTYVNDNVHERSTRSFIKSVRELAGKYSNSKIYIVLADPQNFPCESLKGENIFLLPLKADTSLLNYPLAIKAFVAAQVEKIVKNDVSTLAWFDPATLVLNSLEELDLDNKLKVAIRPVSLLNTIGITPGTEPNDYWAPIYNEFGLDYKNVPAVETVVDEKPIQAYYNCEIFSVDPKLGILTKWAEALTKFLKDENYQNNVCNTFLKRLFLHQAVLSAVITSKANEQDIKSLSIKTGYPFGQHDQLSENKKIKTLNELSAIIFDFRWERRAKWMEKIDVNEPLKGWLINTFIDYCKLTNNLYRIEGQCNSYLITTKDGSVLIDPAGAGDAPDYFKQIIKDHPLKAILLTHAHQDHWDNMEVWHTDSKIPIIAQREFIKYNEYRERLLLFYARRGAIWGRKPIPDSSEIEPLNPVIPTITFADEYTYELGGYHFKMKHTPGETPDHTTIWIPELKAVFVGDNYYKYFINNATLRGTSTRPILGYISTLSLALSYKPNYFLMGHGKSIVKNNLINKTVGNLRDLLQYLNDETIKRINQGKDIFTILQEIKIPVQYRIQPYFGKAEWTIRGIYYENIGWFDENPTSMYSLSISSIYSDLVEIAGADALLIKANEYFENREFVKVLHLTDIVLKSDPDIVNANEIRLKALESLKAGPYNYIEHIWLDYGIKLANEKIQEK